MKSLQYESMGTSWQITVWDDLPVAFWQEVCDFITNASQEFDQTYSRFIKTSLVSGLAERTGVFEVPPDGMALIAWYQKFYALSGKKFTPLIGNTISDLGYDAEYSLVPKKVIRTVPDFDAVVQVVDASHLALTQPTLLDFGALGKGYFVEKIADYLRSKKIKRFLVDGSGDIQYEGAGEKIRVGLEHPGDASKAVGVLEITEGAVCGSGGNRRAWADYHHIIDPQTLTSPKDILATWVWAKTAPLADALATCLFLTEPERYQKEFEFEYCILNSEYKIKRSAGFTAELF